MITEHLLMMQTEGNTGVPYTEKAGPCGNTIRPATPDSEESRKGTSFNLRPITGEVRELRGVDWEFPYCGS